MGIIWLSIFATSGEEGVGRSDGSVLVADVGPQEFVQTLSYV